MDGRPELVISNSGPLITLATIGKLGLLEGLFKQVAIPLAVYEEVVTHGQGEAGSQAVAEASWIQARLYAPCQLLSGVLYLCPIVQRSAGLLGFTKEGQT